MLSGLVVMTSGAACHATFSILALERSSGRFGFASASCVPLETLQRVFEEVPSRGAVATQSYLLDGDLGRKTAVEKLTLGWSASQTLDALLDPVFDPEADKRQYMVIDAEGGLASHTGPLANAYAADATRTEGDWVVVSAGNFLTGPEVLQRALAGFYDASACDLADRLQRAISLAGSAGHGDARCVQEGRAAQSAWLVVGDLDLRVATPDAPSSEDPLDELASQYAAWRATHPCPPEPASGGNDAAAEPSTGSCNLARGREPSASAWSCIVPLLLVRRRRRVAVARAECNR